MNYHSGATAKTVTTATRKIFECLAIHRHDQSSRECTQMSKYAVKRIWLTPRLNCRSVAYSGQAASPSEICAAPRDAGEGLCERGLRTWAVLCCAVCYSVLLSTCAYAPPCCAAERDTCWPD